jgi:hypothetical protein
VTGRPHRRTAGPAWVALLLVGLAALAGCGGDDEPKADPSPTDSTSTSTSPTTGGTSPSGPTSSSTVTPASGPRVVTSRFSLQAPEGFEKRPVAGELLGSFVDLLPDDAIYFGILEDYRPQSLDEMAESYVRNGPFDTRPRFLPHVELDGRMAFHVAGPINDRSWGEAFGALVRGAGVTIEFQIHSPKPRRQEIVDSTMATLRWR